MIVVGGRYLTRPAFRFIARTRLREIFTAAALLLVIGIAVGLAGDDPNRPCIVVYAERDGPPADLPRTLQHGIYKGFIAPAALYAVLGATILVNRRRGDDKDESGRGGER